MTTEKSHRVAILHGTEPWGQCRRTRTNYGPDEWESLLRSRGFLTKRLSVRDIGALLDEPIYEMLVNPFGEDYPEEDNKSERSLNQIVNYVERGGIFVCTGGWPFYFADSPRGRIEGQNRLEKYFHVNVDSGQWWEDNEPVKQPEGSIALFGPLADKGGTDIVSVWRPIQEKYGAVKKILVATKRAGIVLGFLPVRRGGIILTGMSLKGSPEFDKLTSFLTVLIDKGLRNEY